MLDVAQWPRDRDETETHRHHELRISALLSEVLDSAPREGRNRLQLQHEHRVITLLSEEVLDSAPGEGRTAYLVDVG